MWRDASLRRLRDMLAALREIAGFTTGMTYEAFDADIKTIRAVAFDCVIIGEAAGHVAEEMRRRYPEVPWLGMIGLRNIAAHQYFRLDSALLWETATQRVPPLIPVLEEIIAREAPTAP